jgi:ubiquinol-cytochrome c reductase cytochrome b subunit
MKDVNFILIILFIFLSFVGFFPNYLGHPDNYIPADPLVTPAHIVPE